MMIPTESGPIVARATLIKVLKGGLWNISMTIDTTMSMILRHPSSTTRTHHRWGYREEVSL